MPAHVKSSLFGSSVSIPITGGRLNLGTWQVRLGAGSWDVSRACERVALTDAVLCTLSYDSFRESGCVSTATPAGLGGLLSPFRASETSCGVGLAMP